MRISDWSSDVCSVNLWKVQTSLPGGVGLDTFKAWCHSIVEKTSGELSFEPYAPNELVGEFQLFDGLRRGELQAMNSFTQYWSGRVPAAVFRSEEHTSELQSLMRISYAVFCLKKKTK